MEGIGKRMVLPSTNLQKDPKIMRVMQQVMASISTTAAGIEGNVSLDDSKFQSLPQKGFSNY